MEATGWVLGCYNEVIEAIAVSRATTQRDGCARTVRCYTVILKLKLALSASLLSIL